MSKQGFISRLLNTYVYQEQTTSAAIGLDSTDSNKLKINVSTTTGVTPTSPASVVVDPAGPITISPKSTGNIILNNVYSGGGALGATVGVMIIDSTGITGATAAGAAGTVLIGGALPTFSASPSVTSIDIATVNGSDPNAGVNVNYLKTFVSGFTFQPSAVVATTANLNATYSNGAAGVGATLTNAGANAALVIDGVSLALTNRVLVKDQTTTFQNGIYTVTTVGDGVTPWVLTRATDYDMAPSQIKPGNIIFIQQGTINANTLWVETATVTTIGTDPILFEKLTINVGATSFITGSGTATVSGGNITMAGGNNISTTGAGSTVTFNVSGTTNHFVQIGNASGSLSSISPSTSGFVLTSNGVAADPSFVAIGTNSGLTAHGVLLAEGAGAFAVTPVGASGQVLRGSTGADPAWGQVNLATDVTGILPIANGGTNASSMATTDGIVYFDGTRLVTTSAGTAGQVLTSNGAGMAPTYQAGGGSGTGVTITTYNTPGAFVFSKQVATKMIEVFAWGGGGGGASDDGTGNGGSGGGCGSFFNYKLPASFVGGSVNVVVGAGGAGGTAGGNGASGGSSVFGSMATPLGNASGSPVAQHGGFYGSAFSNSSETPYWKPATFGVDAVPTGGSTAGLTNATNNYWGSSLGTGGGAGAPLGGGKGGDIVSPPTYYLTSIAAGSTIILAGGIAGTSGSPNGGPGNAGATATNFFCGGTGGGGAYSNTGTSTFGNGGAGGFPGGGGGGASGFGINAGVVGGAGADGLVIVIEYA